MNFHEYQKAAMRTKNFSLSDNDQLTNAVLGASGEAGELAGAVKKFLFQGHDFDRAKVLDEAGDVMWYLTLLADALGEDLEDIAARNIAKLQKRYPDKFESDHSIARVDTL